MVADSTDRTRVWYLLGTLAVGGTEKTLVDLVNNLDTEAFAPVIWTIAEPGPLASEVTDDVPVHSLQASHKLDIRAVVRFTRELRQANPEILQSFLFYDNVLARLAGQFASKTTVITGIREVPDEPSLARFLVERLTASLSTHAVSNSESGLEYATDTIGVPTEQVSVIPTGRDLTRYTQAAPPSEAGRIVPPRSGPIIGTVGRLVDRKGHHDLLKAWPQIVHASPDATLLIVGDGPERQRLQARADRQGISDSVVFTGTRDDIPDILALIDIFAFPSHYEGMPGALLEAMAAGLPIVTTPVDGNSELVQDGDCGRHVPPHDPDALADAIVGLLNDPAEADRLGTAAAQRAMSAFSINAMVDEFETLYRQFE